MFVRVCWRSGAASLIVCCTATVAMAQAEHQTADAGQAHEMSAMTREGSGTSWLPDASPMYMVHRQRGPWMLMGHENAFLQFFSESGERGDSRRRRGHRRRPGCRGAG